MTTTYVSSGHDQVGYSISGGDVLEILDGGLTGNNAIDAGGTELVDAGGADTGFTAVFEGGLEDVYGVASSGTVQAGTLLVESGGSASHETISYGGTATIFYGGTADNIAVSSGGTAIVLGTVT